jgi:ubiquitin-like domain-containing CTD phosphatase 1
MTPNACRRVFVGVFDCKPLQFLWSKCGEHYNKDNTIMLDDLSRNFIMNKQQGLVIYPFQKAHKNRATDRELVKLKYYFKAIARRDTLTELNHKKWKEYVKKNCTKEELGQMKWDIDNP